MSRLKQNSGAKTLPIPSQSKTLASSRSWMTEHGLRRSFSGGEICQVCGELRQKTYYPHPFPLPAPLGKGHWLLSDCACIKKERSLQRSARNKLLTGPSQHPLPLGLRQHTFSSFKTTEFNRQAHKVCQDFMRNFNKIQRGQGLLLFGRAGTGKTHLASAIANGLQGNFTVAFAYFPSLLEKLRTGSLGLEPFLAADLLILDDIGSDRETGWLMERFLVIVDGRLTSLRPTVFTTNYDLEDLDKRIGMRAASRILGHNLQVLVQGPDWRLMQHKR